jgi:hypothetical protein
LEELTVEEIPQESLSPTKANLQSYSSWRQAESQISDEAFTEIHRSEITGSSASNTTK